MRTPVSTEAVSTRTRAATAAPGSRGSNVTVAARLPLKRVSNSSPPALMRAVIDDSLPGTSWYVLAGRSASAPSKPPGGGPMTPGGRASRAPAGARPPEKAQSGTARGKMAMTHSATRAGRQGWSWVRSRWRTNQATTPSVAVNTASAAMASSPIQGGLSGAMRQPRSGSGR